jgi:hypothetical protein
MTALELYARRSGKKSAKRRVFVSKALSPVRTRMRSALHTSAAVATPRELQTTQASLTEKPMIHPFTLHAMEVEVVALIRESPGKECSVYAMASALLNSHRVMELHKQTRAEPEEIGFEEPMQKLSRSMSRFQFQWPHQNKKLQLQRSYQLVNALHALKERVGSEKEMIQSFEKAKIHLKTVLAFEKDDKKTREQSTTDDDDDDDELEDIVQKYKKKAHSLLLLDQQRSIGLSHAQRKWQQIASQPITSRTTELSSSLAQSELETIRLARQQKSAALQELQARTEQLELDHFAQESASQLLRPLTPEERALVNETLHTVRPDDFIVQKDGADVCQHGSMQTLLPRKWVNDEVIHFFLLMLAKRDAALVHEGKRQRPSHFFKSFFATKLLNHGHLDPTMEGQYQYANVKRWSKKVPGACCGFRR